MIPVPVGVAGNTRSVVGRNVRYLAPGQHFLHLGTPLINFRPTPENVQAGQALRV